MCAIQYKPSFVLTAHRKTSGYPHSDISFGGGHHEIQRRTRVRLQCIVKGLKIFRAVQLVESSQLVRRIVCNPTEGILLPVVFRMIMRIISNGPPISEHDRVGNSIAIPDEKVFHRFYSRYPFAIEQKLL